jgi:hypothetical protein
MEHVKVYKTKDGTLHQDRSSAETHELMLNLRGIIQSHVRGTSFSPTEIANILAKEQQSVYDTLGKFRRTMAGIKSNTIKG